MVRITTVTITINAFFHEEQKFEHTLNGSLYATGSTRFRLLSTRSTFGLHYGARMTKCTDVVDINEPIIYPGDDGGCIKKAQGRSDRMNTLQAGRKS